MYGKQYITTKMVTTICKDKESEGVITDQKLHPGDIIFTNKYQKIGEGRVFSQIGPDFHQLKCLSVFLGKVS